MNHHRRITTDVADDNKTSPELAIWKHIFDSNI